MLDFIPIFAEQASTFAPRTDALFFFLTIVSAIITLVIFLGIIFLGVKYRHKPGEDRPSVPYENVALEIAWTVIPGIAFIGIFFWGALLSYDFYNVPEDAMEINVVGKQWMWKIQHPNGRREVNSLHIPLGQPVKLTMTSQDVIHDFYIPAFRVKQDLLPGRRTQMWFEATKKGEYHLFCAEYCGTNHSTMGGTVYVMDPADYQEWLEGGPALPPVMAGEMLYQKLGCMTCHDAGARSRGPELQGMFLKEVTLKDGSVVTADETYIKESLLDPTAKIVEGFTPLMPNFTTQLNTEEIAQIIAYIKSLGDETPSRLRNQ